MKTTANPVHLAFFICFTILLASCDSKNLLSPVEHAQKIRLHINNNNVKELRDLSSLPLIIRNQEWISATDGTGFILGEAKKSILSNDEKFNAYMPSFIKTVTIEGEKAISEDINLSMFTSELGNQLNDWKGLNFFLFKRGEGDVEHIVLMGLNTNNKLQGLYIN